MQKSAKQKINITSPQFPWLLIVNILGLSFRAARWHSAVCCIGLVHGNKSAAC